MDCLMQYNAKGATATKSVHNSIKNGVGNCSSAWVDANNLTLGDNQWTPLILNNCRGTECKCMAKSAVNHNVAWPSVVCLGTKTKG
jgi:hypothetical protein